MTVQELIEILGNYQQDAEVHYSYGAGDHWRTTVAPAVCQIHDGTVQYSDYHRMDTLVDEDELREEEGDYMPAVRRVVVIG